MTLKLPVPGRVNPEASSDESTGSSKWTHECTRASNSEERQGREPSGNSTCVNVHTDIIWSEPFLMVLYTTTRQVSRSCIYSLFLENKKF